MESKFLNITLLSVLLYLVLYGCTEKPTKVITDNAFVLSKKDYEAVCFKGKIKNDTLYPTKCLIEITSSEKIKFQKKILSQSKEKWITLLKSKNIQISISASIWLYSISKQKVELTKLGAIEQGKIQKEEMIFWSSYFNRSKH